MTHLLSHTAKFLGIKQDNLLADMNNLQVYETNLPSLTGYVNNPLLANSQLCQWGTHSCRDGGQSEKPPQGLTPALKAKSTLNGWKGESSNVIPRIALLQGEGGF